MVEPAKRNDPGDIPSRIIPASELLLLPTFERGHPLQVAARLTRPPEEYPSRIALAINTTWENIDLSTYNPVDFTAENVSKGPAWADPADIRHAEGYPRFLSHEGPAVLGADGRPRNPLGPTGIQGRGRLGKWGANFAGDAIVTRISPEGKLELLLEQRADTLQWAVPGGMVDRGENAVKTINREIGEELGIEIDFTNAVIAYQGALYDRRNTDNAWMETDARHLHLPTGTEFTFTPNPREVVAVKWEPISITALSELYGSHAHIVKMAVHKWQEQTGLRVDRRGFVGRAA